MIRSAIKVLHDDGVRCTKTRESVTILDGYDESISKHNTNTMI